MYLPTYGYIGSPENAGPVSWHFCELIWRSWLTTTLSSLVMCVSSSSVLTPSRRAFAKPGRDSSVVMPMPPRWACRSNWVFCGSTPRPVVSGVAWATAEADRHKPATLTAVATTRRALMGRTLGVAHDELTDSR